jgi:hypothetical protein
MAATTACIGGKACIRLRKKFFIEIHQHFLLAILIRALARRSYLIIIIAEKTKRTNKVLYSIMCCK